MRLIRSILFEREERELFTFAANLIDIAYPPATGPLAPSAEAVPDDDPHRRVLNGLRQAWDPIGQSRLALGVETLTRLRQVLTEQSSPDWWRAQVPDRPLSDTEESMTRALVEERTRQARTVAEALAVAERALAQLSKTDDPQFWRAAQYADAWPARAAPSLDGSAEPVSSGGPPSRGLPGAPTPPGCGATSDVGCHAARRSTAR